MLGKGTVVCSHAWWASVLTGDVPSTNDEGSKDEVVVTDTVLADVTVVIGTDETGAEDVGTGWSSGVADGVGDWSRRPSSPLGADELELADKDKPNCPLAIHELFVPFCLSLVLYFSTFNDAYMLIDCGPF